MNGIHKDGFSWYPFFYKSLNNLQETYDTSTSQKEFYFDEVEIGKKYVDSFLFKMSKLIIFT